MHKKIAIGQDPVLRLPVNRQAARVTSPGFKYEPVKKLTSDESALPIPFRRPLRKERANPSFVDLTGAKVGRLLVLGLTDSRDGAPWVCRCECGRFVQRTKKAITNPNNVQDRCGHCRHLAFLKREEHFRTYGKDRDIRHY